MAEERGILYSTWKVQAILKGATQTRRPNGLEVINEHPDEWVLYESYPHEGVFYLKDKSGELIKAKCPWGRIGDGLYGRETYYQDILGGLVCYKADYPEGDRDFPPKNTAGKVIPSIHMPKEFSRIHQEITDIRLQRVQNISEEDVDAEGLKFEKVGDDWKWLANGRIYILKSEAYFDLWTQINGYNSGLGNPWVWALTLKE